MTAYSDVVSINRDNVLFVKQSFDVHFDGVTVRNHPTNPLEPKSLEDLIAHLDDAELCQLQRIIELRQI